MNRKVEIDIPSKNWRTSVKLRDQGRCVICGDVGTNAHHIYCEGYYPELCNDVNNGVTLCRICHTLVHRGKFGATCKGKYEPSFAIEKLKQRASSRDKYQTIVDLVMADVESVNKALASKNRTA